MVNIGLIALLGLFTLMFIRNVFDVIFGFSKTRQQRKRLKQLDINPKNAMNMEEILSKASSPVEKHVLPYIKKYDLTEISKKLAFTGWDKYFTPITFFCLNITLKIIAVALLLLFSVAGYFVLGLIWCIPLAFLLNFMLNSKVDQKKTRIISDFPTFLRITRSYLTMPKVTIEIAAQNAARFVGSEWKEIISEFCTRCQISGRDEGVKYLKDSTGMFEIKEFASILSLVMEKGGSAIDAFEAQASAVVEIQKYLAEKKITTRKAYGTVLQLPMLLSVFAAFGLPLVEDLAAIGLF